MLVVRSISTLIYGCSYMGLCNFHVGYENVCAMDFHHKSFLTLCYYYYYHYIVIGLFTFILSCAGMCPKTYLTIYVMVKTTQSAFVRWYRHIWTSFNTTDSKSPSEQKFHGEKKSNTHTDAKLKGDMFNVMLWMSLASAFKV